SIASVQHFGVDNCTSTDSAVEGLNVEDSMWGQVANCRFVFPGTGGYASMDFGMSLFAYQSQCAGIAVVGNVIDSPAKACLGLASAGASAPLTRIRVLGNVFTSPSSQAPSVDFAPETPAVVIYGGGAHDIEVSENEIKDLAGHMTVKVMESGI